MKLINLNFIFINNKIMITEKKKKKKKKKKKRILRSATQNDDEETKAELEKLFQELSKAKGFQFFSEPFLVKKVSEFQYDGDKEQLEKKSCGNGACCNSCSNKPKPETEDSPKPSLENHTQKLESYKTQIKNILQKQGKTFEF